jgi:hypothetical protein
MLFRIFRKPIDLHTAYAYLTIPDFKVFPATGRNFLMFLFANTATAVLEVNRSVLIDIDFVFYIRSELNTISVEEKRKKFANYDRDLEQCKLRTNMLCLSLTLKNVI